MVQAIRTNFTHWGWVNNYVNFQLITRRKSGTNYVYKVGGEPKTAKSPHRRIKFLLTQSVCTLMRSGYLAV